MSDAAGGSFSDDELDHFMQLLRRFATHELDQWERWRFDTPYGEVFVHITRKPCPGGTPEAYDKLTYPDN